MRGLSRTLVLFACIGFIVTAPGCSDEPTDADDDESSQQGTSGQNASAQDVDAQAGFNPNDFDATVLWIARQTAYVTQADENRNELLAAQRLEEVQSTFDVLNGQSVHWEVPVIAITGDYVLMQSDYSFDKDVLGDDEGYGQYWIGLHIFGIAESEPPTRLPAGGSWNSMTNFAFDADNADFQPRLPIGTVIGTEQAMQLAAGDRVLVTGKIAYCVLSGSDSFTSRALALCIVDAKCPD